ncbi:MAG TPA: hypothetical protein ENN18_01450 [Proteobacteria bacterium]|nr:hypothetical protein [Pseudomonadota bacterium]
MIDLLSKLIGIIGGTLGIVSWISVRLREKRIHREQDEMWQMYVGVLKAFKEGSGNVWTPEIGSDEHRLAEKMVERSRLERVPMGGYALPGTFLTPQQ